MGTVLAIANQKGGVGKTTIATNLAVEAATAGHRTLLVDTDPQSSSMLFSAARGEREPVFQTVQMTQAIIHRDVPAMAQDYDFVVLDAGGRDSATFRSALVAADRVVVPVTPSAYDVWASEDVFKMLDEISITRENLRWSVLFNLVIPRTNVAKEALDAVAEYKVTVMDCRLFSRVAWKQAAGEGKGVREWEANGQAGRELMALYRELDLFVMEEVQE